MVEAEKTTAQILSDSYAALKQAIIDGDHETVNENTKAIVKHGEANKIQ